MFVYRCDSVMRAAHWEKNASGTIPFTDINTKRAKVAIHVACDKRSFHHIRWSHLWNLVSVEHTGLTVSSLPVKNAAGHPVCTPACAICLN